MSRKHHTKHPERSKSKYPGRLAKRGLSPARVRMETIEALEAIQRRRKEDTGVPWYTKRHEAA
jgi:hypothetical protein